MTDRPPALKDCPGLAWRLRKGGWEARWRARGDLIKAGYLPKNARLWTGATEKMTPTIEAWISDRCVAMQDEMLAWSRGGVPAIAGKFDGTMGSLIRSYRTDPVSPFHKCRYATRVGYARLLDRLEDEHGETNLGDTVDPDGNKVDGLKARHILGWHQKWSENGKVAMAHAFITMLRILMGFGTTILESDECERLTIVLHKLKFKNSKPREEYLTPEQAIAARNHARATRPSLALAQAFQFECTLRQKDVIGEWVPMSEPGVSDVLSGSLKWLRGIRFEEIDEHLVLRHMTSKRQKPLTIDLKNAPMVLEEWLKVYPDLVVVFEAAHPITKKVTRHVTVNRDLLPAAGPIIRDEMSGAPYRATEFRKHWRKSATAVGIPKGVYNMDSRAGAITEALQAGARPESVRKSAAHSNLAMTQRYNRGDEQDIAEAMKIRAASRNTNGTSGK